MMRLVARGLRSLVRRLGTEGFRPTVAWVSGRVLPYLTGVPTLRRYSRITPALYIGAQHNAVGKRRLERLGIHNSVSLREEFDDAAHGLALANHCYLPTVDETAPTLEQLRQGVAFIADVVARRGRVYIHCASGVGRAPTLAAAYLICQGCSPEEAVAQIKRVRPFVELTPAQLAQLERFEALERDQGAA